MSRDELAGALAGAGPFLFAFAHPDDETLSCGTLLAELGARGAEVLLVTGTRGEEGEVVPGPLSGLAGTDQLITHRENELRCAAKVLGVEQHVWLGEPPARASGRAPRRYRDSGMRWVRPGLAGPAEHAADDALCVASLEEVSGDLAALLAAWRPTLVIGDGAAGGYGHPDHVRMHHAGLAAARQAQIPFVAVGSQRSPDDLWFEGAPRLPQVADALACYASQVTVDGMDVVHSGGQRTAIVASFGLHPMG